MNHRRNFVLTLLFILFTFGVLAGVDPSLTQYQQPAELPDLYEASISELEHGLDCGDYTSVDLVKA